jgi:hypothetical protein
LTIKNLPYHSTVRAQWRDLYRAALFETDEQKLPGRIAEAEKVLIERARELFPTFCNNIEEARAVDDALYSLRALRHSLELRTRQSSAA